MNAARIVKESTGATELVPGDAKAVWSAHIQAVDQRDMTLLKPSVEAGYEAGR